MTRSRLDHGGAGAAQRRGAGHGGASWAATSRSWRRARSTGSPASRSPPLAPEGDDEILVTRLADGSSVFVGKTKMIPRIEARIAALEDRGVALNVLLCTGEFPRLAARRPFLEPQQLLLGLLRAMRLPGRLGVLTPSERHVPQTTARWRASGFDAHVAPLSPYEENDPAAVRRAADALRAGHAGLVVMDCIGFRRKTRDEIAALTGAPTLVANLLVARVAAELLGR